MQPQVVKYFDEEMPIIVSHCCKCNVALSKSMTYEIITFHKNYCIVCISEIENKAWRYDQLNK